MAVKDSRSYMLPELAFSAAISSDTTTNGAIIDTAKYELGLTFNVAAAAWTDGTYTFTLEESDDSGMSGAVDIDDSKLIGTEAGLTISAAETQGDILGSIGVFSNLRYVRLKVTSTSTATGATIVSILEKSGEICPDPLLSA